MDWGLALLVRDVVRTTRDQNRPEAWSSVGTPAYMSPEAALADSSDFDERTDVFGLGAILYQVVTGTTPHGGASPEETLASAKLGKVRDPETMLGGVGVSKRLIRILQKALARDRDDRHQSAAELKSDVQRFLRGGLYLPRQGFSKGESIVVEGEIGDAAYVIVSGECEAFKTIDGQKRVLRRMGPGEVFGETAVLSELPRTASVAAIDNVTVLVVDRVALEEGLGLDTWLGTLVRALAMRFRELDAEIHGLPSR
jgi:serine/threonine-protein kinase